MTIFVLSLIFALSSNPYIEELVNRTRHTRITKADSLWTAYIESLVHENKFTENPAQIGVPENIKDYETKFINREISEAEFAYFLGYEFARNAQSMESEWFLNKSESLGYVCAETYLMHATNYAKEWNDYLHYNEDLSDPHLTFYENKWRESLKKFISLSKDSISIEKARLQLTCIYWPFRTPIFINEFAPVAIKNLEDFIKKYPKSSFVGEAYSRLVWWLSETKNFKKLKEVCLNFLEKHSTSQLREYIKLWLGISYLETKDSLNAEKIFSTINTDSLPNSVYPGWGKRYIIEFYENKLLDKKNEK